MLYIKAPSIVALNGLRCGRAEFDVLSINGERYSSPACATLAGATANDYIDLAVDMVAGRQVVIMVSLSNGNDPVGGNYSKPGPIRCGVIAEIDGVYMDSSTVSLSMNHASQSAVICFGYTAPTDGLRTVRVSFGTIKFAYIDGGGAWHVNQHPSNWVPNINLSVVVWL
jgi:hypothetical protein